MQNTQDHNIGPGAGKQPTKLSPTELVEELFSFDTAQGINNTLLELLGTSMSHEALNEFPQQRDNLCLTIQKLTLFFQQCDKYFER